MSIISVEKPQNLLYVNFTNRGLSKVFKSVRSLDSRTPDKNSVVEVSKLLKDVKVTSKEPIGFASIPEFVGLDYVGYVIDKERLDKSTGQWERIDEYRVLGTKASNFKDSRVAYGNCYRYRIKAIIKVTHKKEIELSDQTDIEEDLRDVEAAQAEERLMAQQEVIAKVDRIVSRGLAPVTSVSSGTPNTSTTTLAGNKQTFSVLENLVLEATPDTLRSVAVPADTAIKNIANLRQLKNLTVSDSSLAEGKVSTKMLEKIVQESLKSFKESRFEYVSFYYRSVPSEWQYVQIAEFIPPPPPSAISIVPNSPEGNIMITWLTPANSQRDIVSFKLYRRSRVGQPWDTVGKFDLVDNLFVDKAVKFDVEYIYALTSVDAHGFESTLSTQIQAELNPNFITEGQERGLRWISGSGARPDKGFTSVFKKFFEPEVPIVAQDNVVIGPTTLFNDVQKKYVVRIKSLDVHEQKEFVISLENENVGTKGI